MAAEREGKGKVKVYGMALSGNVVRVATALNEKGIDFDIVPVDLRTAAHKHPDFLALNPFGQIPVLQDGDEVLYESRAINRYIATKYKAEGADLLPAAASTAKLEVWLEVESNHFYPAVSQLVYQLLVKPLLGGAPDTAVVDKQAGELAKVLDVYDAHLAANRYLAGDHFTLADVNHMGYLFFLGKTPKAELLTSRPHVKAWWDDISGRPAWKKTAAAIPIPPPA
ncbi:glutathione S-transferase 3 [Oryza brachyantha]|uniref:glutathione S-transferase 3 n=1 Tax=Oryza brachyantha TaxID=4533 RepID=UPI0003EA7FC5|nr:glutathione S-transferase 3 [Oryza brachyantha]